MNYYQGRTEGGYHETVSLKEGRCVDGSLAAIGNGSVKLLSSLERRLTVES